MNFSQKVLQIVSQIPGGETLSYKEVAIMAGSPNAYRAVGSILKRNWDPNIPCHRVIKNNGSFGNYNRGEQQKTELLLKERAEFFRIKSI